MQFYFLYTILRLRTINCFGERNRSHVQPAKPRQNDSSTNISTINQPL